MRKAFAIAIVGGAVAGAIVGLGLHVIPHSDPLRRAAKQRTSHLSENDWQAIRSSLEQLAAGGQGRLVFRLLHPAAIAAPDGKSVPSLPPDVRVAIARQGANPAEIVVQQNGKQWNATEDKLDQLPPSVKVYVERALTPFLVARTSNTKGVEAARADCTVQSTPGTDESHIEKRLQELNRQIDQILRSISELRTKPHG